MLVHGDPDPRESLLQVGPPSASPGPDPLVVRSVCSEELGDAESVREGEVNAQRSGRKSRLVILITEQLSLNK